MRSHELGFNLGQKRVGGLLSDSASHARQISGWVSFDYLRQPQHSSICFKLPKEVRVRGGH